MKSLRKKAKRNNARVTLSYTVLRKIAAVNKEEAGANDREFVTQLIGTLGISTSGSVSLIHKKKDLSQSF